MSVSLYAVPRLWQEECVALIPPRMVLLGGVLGWGLFACSAQTPFSPPDLGSATDFDLSTAQDDLAPSAPDLAVPTGPRTFTSLMEYTDALHGILYAHGAVYAVRSSGDAIEIFDAMTRMHVKTLPVGLVPAQIAADDSHVYVINMLAKDLGDAYLSIIDPVTQTVTATVDVDEKFWGSDPDNYPWTNFPSNVGVVGSRVYVVFPTNAVPGLVPIDVGTWSEQTYQPAGSGPANFAGVGERIVMTNLQAIFNPNDDVIRVQTLSGDVLHTIASGGKLHDAVLVGDEVWVARAPVGAAGELWVVDPQTGAYETVTTAQGAYGLAVAGNLVYVACTEGRRVQAYDATTRALVEDIDLATLAPTVVNARGIAVTPDHDIYLESDGMLSLLSH